MRVLFQLTICICMIILAGGTIAYLLEGPSFGGGLLLLAIWGAMVAIVVPTSIFTFETDQEKFKWQAKKANRDSSAPERIGKLEKRLSDIQDVVITIDEKLSRIERDPLPRVSEKEG